MQVEGVLAASGDGDFDDFVLGDGEYLLGWEEVGRLVGAAEDLEELDVGCERGQDGGWGLLTTGTVGGTKDTLWDH